MTASSYVIRRPKRLTKSAVGYCTLCGNTLRGDAIDAGPEPGDNVCLTCADEIADLVRPNTKRTSRA